MDFINPLFRLAFGRRHSVTQGVLRLPCLRDAVTLHRDDHGIAYIEAGNEHDAWFGLGFAQAQDRAFQLELRLRTQRGTLSKLFGEETLGIDRLSRRIGFAEASQRQLAVLDDEVRCQIEAFVQGINAGLRAGGPRAPEFLLLRATPTEWRPEDVLALGKLLSFLLLGNWDVELARLKILTLDGPQALRDLDPTPYPEDQVVAAMPGKTAGKALDALGEDLASFMKFAGVGGGSNAWVVAGSRTASGKPILANDPHLEAVMPPHWYLAQIRTPGWAVAGASMVGAPAIGVGHNGYAAWGLTAGLVDTVDLFVEEVGPDGRSVPQGDAFEGCEVRREVIEVRGRPPVTEEVVVTPRGPIIGPALREEAGAVSLRAIWLDALPARGFLRSHLARSFDSFRTEFEHWPLLSQNVVFAAEDGTIAWQLVGQAPVRKRGKGTLPQAGWHPEAGWLDKPVPFEQMPHTNNPGSGYLVTANNKPARESRNGPYLGVDWLDGYRAGRIDECLAARKDWDVASTLALQKDERSLAWLEVRDIIFGLAPEDEEARLALSLLTEWDGQIAADSPAASVFELFFSEMRRRIARSRAPNSVQYALGRGFADVLPVTTFAAGRHSRVLRRLREQPAGWFERSWQDEMLDALASVAKDLRTRFGSEPQKWHWGQIRPLTLEHPMGRVKALAPLFNRGPFAWGGDANTISQTGGAPGRASGDPPVIASLRAVIEVGDWENVRFVLPGGQSGDPFSPHYDDLVSLWKRGDGVTIAWSEESVRRAAVATLKLLPLSGTESAAAGSGPIK
jgi:penicillin amidase